jgi:hypothetical protein
VCRLDSTTPAPSAAGEYWAVALAAIFRGGRPTTIVTDTASIITSLARPGFSQDPKGMYSGALRQHKVQSLVREWNKGRSHRERSTAVQEGWESYWGGNQRADYWEGRATSSADSPDVRAMDSHRKQQTEAALAAFKLVHGLVGPALLRSPVAEKAAAAAAAVGKAPHAFQWAPICGCGSAHSASEPRPPRSALGWIGRHAGPRNSSSTRPTMWPKAGRTAETG